jgi:phenylacetate-CoA ligase
MKFPYKSLEEIREYQFKRIKELLIEAFEHVPFYRKLYTKCNVDVYSINSLEDFARKIPCITKKDITDHVDEFISDKFRKDALTLSRSSGTSGTVVDLYADENVYIDVEIQVIRMIKEIYDNYSPFDKEVLVYTSEYPVSSIMGFYRSYYINNLKD